MSITIEAKDLAQMFYDLRQYMGEDLYEKHYKEKAEKLLGKTYNGIFLKIVHRPLICEVCTKSEKQPEGKCKENHRPRWDKIFDTSGKFVCYDYKCIEFNYGNWG